MTDLEMTASGSGASQDRALAQGTPETPKKGRLKKKSAVAKLAEKKRKNLVPYSDIESDFGSVISVSKPETKQSDAVDIVTLDSDLAENSSNMYIEPNVVIKNLPSSNIGDLEAAERPRPKPRKRVRSGGDEGKLPTGTEHKYPVGMDIFEDAVSDDEKNDPLKGSQTDATLHRFRNLRMATERSGSVESLKSSPFMPKPPTTPRKSPGNSSKGEKRLRDPYSSGEEQDIAHKKQSSDVGLINKNSNGLDSLGAVVKTSNTVVSLVDAEKRITPRGQVVERFIANESKADSTLGSASDLRDIHTQYRKVLKNNETPRDNIYGTADSVMTDMSVSTTHLGKLTPITPKGHPPPLLSDFSSRGLRTAYKIDQGHRPYSVQTSASGTTYRSNFDNISQRSFASSSVLPLITTKEARERSFLVGSVGSGSGSLLGADELDRYFPDRRANIWVGSWNMNEIKDLSASLDDFLLPEACEYVQDIYVVATQENAMNKREWEVIVQETLGPSHVMFHSVTLGSLHLVVFIRRDLIWFCSRPEDDTVSTRAVTMVKTKGAIAASFTLFGTSLLFINCHFTSDYSRKKERLGDYQKITQGLKLPKSSMGSPPSSGNSDVTSKFDCVFWCGDLNFRIERRKTAVEGMVTHIQSQAIPNFEDLLGGDQLTKCIVEGKIFQGFQEGRINFRPTYKFDVNTDNYDTSAKSRIPSYTDRILFRSKKKNTISCVQYDAVVSVKVSDHKPVYALYETAVRPGRDNIQLALGHFDRTVYLEANKRRSLHRAADTKQQKNSTVCTVQ